MTNTDLFSKLLEGPYSHFKKVGEDDWRDIGTRNPGFSISSKGYFNHNSGLNGSLLDLCKDHKLISAGNHKLFDLGEPNICIHLVCFTKIVVVVVCGIRTFKY